MIFEFIITVCLCILTVNSHFGDYASTVRELSLMHNERLTVAIDAATFQVLQTSQPQAQAQTQTEDLLYVGTTRRLMKLSLHTLLPRQTISCTQGECSSAYVNNLGFNGTHLFGCLYQRAGAIFGCSIFSEGNLDDRIALQISHSIMKRHVYAVASNKFHYMAMVQNNVASLRSYVIDVNPVAVKSVEGGTDGRIYLQPEPIALAADQNVVLAVFREEARERLYSSATFDEVEVRFGRACVNDPSAAYRSFQKAALRCWNFLANRNRGDWKIDRVAFAKNRDGLLKGMVVTSRNASNHQYVCYFGTAFPDDVGMMPRKWLNVRDGQAQYMSDIYCYDQTSNTVSSTSYSQANFLARMSCAEMTVFTANLQSQTENCFIRSPVQNYEALHAVSIGNIVVHKLVAFEPVSQPSPKPHFFAIRADGIMDLYAVEGNESCLIDAFVLHESSLTEANVAYAEIKHLSNPRRWLLVIALANVDQKSNMIVVSDEALCRKHNLFQACNHSMNAVCGWLNGECVPQHDRAGWLAAASKITCRSHILPVWSAWSEEYSCRNDTMKMCRFDAITGTNCEGQQCYCQSRICLKDSCPGDSTSTTVRFHHVQRRRVSCHPAYLEINRRVTAAPVDEGHDTYQVIGFTFLGCFSVMIIFCFLFTVFGPGGKEIKKLKTRWDERRRRKRASRSASSASQASNVRGSSAYSQASSVRGASGYSQASSARGASGYSQASQARSRASGYASSAPSSARRRH